VNEIAAHLVEKVFPLQQMKLIAFVVQASEIRRILDHIGLPTEAPKAQPAREPPQGDLWGQAGTVGPEDEDQSVQW
jgi:hypothetical protein